MARLASSDDRGNKSYSCSNSSSLYEDKRGEERIHLLRLIVISVIAITIIFLIAYYILQH